MDEAGPEARGKSLLDKGRVIAPVQEGAGRQLARLQRHADGQAVEEVLQARRLARVEGAVLLVPFGDEIVHEGGGLDLVMHRYRFDPPEEPPR